MKELFLKHDRVNPENDAKVLELYRAAEEAYDSLLDLDDILDNFDHIDIERASFELNKVDVKMWLTCMAGATQMLRGAVVTREHFEKLLEAFVAEGKETETKGE